MVFFRFQKVADLGEQRHRVGGKFLFDGRGRRRGFGNGLRSGCRFRCDSGVFLLFDEFFFEKFGALFEFLLRVAARCGWQ